MKPHEVHKGTRAVYREWTGTVFAISNTGKSCWFSPDEINIGINADFYMLKPEQPKQVDIDEEGCGTFFAGMETST